MSYCFNVSVINARLGTFWVLFYPGCLKNNPDDVKEFPILIQSESLYSAEEARSPENSDVMENSLITWESRFKHAYFPGREMTQWQTAVGVCVNSVETGTAAGQRNGSAERRLAERWIPTRETNPSWQTAVATNDKDLFPHPNLWSCSLLQPAVQIPTLGDVWNKVHCGGALYCYNNDLQHFFFFRWPGVLPFQSELINRRYLYLKCDSNTHRLHFICLHKHWTDNINVTALSLMNNFRNVQMFTKLGIYRIKGINRGIKIKGWFYCI